MIRFIPVLCLVFLTGCDGLKKYRDSRQVEREREWKRHQNKKNGIVTKEDSMSQEEKRDAEDGKLFGDSLKFGEGSGGGSTTRGDMGVNATLWRAALDTISFMPLRTVDPVGGVIISEWYSPINEPTERFKVDIVILGKTLTANSIRVSLHKQRLSPQNEWRSIEASDESVRELEDSILTRARELRRGSTGL